MEKPKNEPYRLKCYNMQWLLKGTILTQAEMIALIFEDD